MILTMLVTTLCAMIVLIPIAAAQLLFCAGGLWLACWALNALGVYVIHGFAVEFSWPLAVLVWLVWLVIHGIFTPVKSGDSNKK